ncbi:MAG: hypothetical protein ACRCW2_01165 [Cellulosilyticaceae bacterium]
MKRWKKLSALLLACPMILAGCTTSGTKGGSEEAVQAANTQQEEGVSKEKGAPKIVTMGNPGIVDPRYRDPVTGESPLPADELHAAEKALQAVMDELNVDLQFVQYPGRPDEVLLQSVLAGDPIADLVYMWIGSQGTVLTQNVLQPLDDYAYIFEGEHEWMLWDEVAGSRFFVNSNITFTPWWPLIYNIDYIEQVDALKVDGETVYPTDLFLDGRWTWSVFEDYLAKIDAHFANSKAPVRPEKRIEAYQTDYREAVLQATYANGSSIYGKDGLQVATPETKESVAYVKKLMDKGLLTCQLWQEGNAEPGWVANCINFQNGETVFTNSEGWRIPNAAQGAAERGESIGMVPFPRADAIPAGDPRYQQAGTAADCVGVLKGVSPEQTELALKTYAVYYSTYYKELCGGETALDYKGFKAETMAADLGLDIFHPVVGADILETFNWMADNIEINDYSQLTDVYYKQFMPFLGDSFYGYNGVPQYDVAIEMQKGVFDDYINNILTIVQSNEIRDNIAPKFKALQTAAFPVGTDPSTIAWAEYLSVTDGVDGDLDMETATIDVSATDFGVVGLYEKGTVGTIKDKSGNEGKANVNMVIYDIDHTEAPTIIFKEEARKLALDEETSEIKWNDFIEVAVDKDGLDLKKTVEADLSELDTATAGKYNVAITVTDYIGNKTTQALEVEVN